MRWRGGRRWRIVGSRPGDTNMKRLLVATALCLAAAPALAALPVGSSAPEFTAAGYLAGKPLTFDLKSALKKGPVVLYFFPRDRALLGQVPGRGRYRPVDRQGVQGDAADPARLERPHLLCDRPQRQDHPRLFQPGRRPPRRRDPLRRQGLESGPPRVDNKRLRPLHGEGPDAQHPGWRRFADSASVLGLIESSPP